MTTCKIAKAEGYDGSPLKDLKDWNVPLTKAHVARMIRDGQAREVVLKHRPQLLKNVTYARASGVRAWQGDGASATLSGHVIRARPIVLGDGTVEIDARRERWNCQVFIARKGDKLLAYFVGNSDDADRARGRLAERLHPERPRGWFEPLKIDPKEVATILDTDCIDESTITIIGGPDGGGIREGIIKGEGVATSAIMGVLPRDQRTRAAFGSRHLSPKNQKDVVRTVAIVGTAGTVTSSSAGVDDIHDYLRQVVLPVMRKNRPPGWLDGF